MQGNNILSNKKKLIQNFWLTLCPQLQNNKTRVNYMEEISIKSDVKNVKYYQISKKLL